MLFIVNLINAPVQGIKKKRRRICSRRR